MRPAVFAACAILVASASAQTITATDAAGDVVLEAITVNPLGVAVTQIIETLTPAGAVGAAAPVTTTVVNPAGATVVEIISVNAAGLPVTQTVQTLPPGVAVTPITTTVLDLAGATVVEVISTDADGDTVTQIIRTLTTTSTVATTVPGQVGPVGAPPPTDAPGQVTSYTYTTTDANGNTIAVPAVFTPTFPPSATPITLSSGTVLGYSEWTSLVGTFTVPSGPVRNAGTPLPLPGLLVSAAAAALASCALWARMLYL